MLQMPRSTESGRDTDGVFGDDLTCIRSMDLKIARIALAHNATLLTRNASDFAQVPGPRFENWLD